MRAPDLDALPAIPRDPEGPVFRAPKTYEQRTYSLNDA